MSAEYELLDYVTSEIKKQYDISDEKAYSFAKDAIKQIRAHGGNPHNKEETNKVIEVVVKSWVERYKGQKK